MKTPFIPAWLFEQDFNPQELSLYCYIAMRGDCWENKRSIAQALGMSKDSFYRHLNSLVSHGWVTMSWKGRKRSLKVTDSGKPIQRKCLKSGTPNVSSEGHVVSHFRDTKCRTTGTLTNQELINRTNRIGEAYSLIYQAGKSMRGSGPTMEERRWKEASNG